MRYGCSMYAICDDAYAGAASGMLIFNTRPADAVCRAAGAGAPSRTKVATGVSCRPDSAHPTNAMLANDVAKARNARYRMAVLMVLLIIRLGRASVRRVRTTARSGRARSTR